MPFPSDLIKPSCALSGIELDDLFFERADFLVREVLRWNKRIRLVGHRDPRTAYIDLVLDGLALIPHFAGRSILDIGSGAGFPGLVLALALPGYLLTMVEGRAKKVSFQKHAVRELGIGQNTEPVLGRAGEGALENRSFDNVTLRAVADLSSCATLASPYLSQGGRIVLPRSFNDRSACLEAGFSVFEYRLPERNEPRLIAVGPGQ